MLGDLKQFEGVVPLPKGEVHVSMNHEMLFVCSSVPGGTLIYNNQEYPLIPGQEVQVQTV